MSLDISSVIANGAGVREVLSAGVRKPFEELLLDFVGELSKRILNEPAFRRSPEIVALGFWLRPSHIQQLLQEFRATYEKETHQVSLWKPRGTVVHFSPGNVDSIAIYSWILSLLCGNRNIVRLSTRTSEWMERLWECVDRVFGEERFAPIARSNSIVRYEHSEEITRELCSHADTRVIWGGDDTVRHIRTFPIPPTANEIAFPNKLSLGVISFADWSQCNSDLKRELARNFALDAFQFGQQACASPRILVWIGTNIEQDGVEEFWGLVEEAIPTLQVSWSDREFVDKLATMDYAATQFPLKRIAGKDNRIVRTRIALSSLRACLESDVHCGGGLFYELEAESFEAILPHLPRTVQTISHAFDSDKLLAALEKSSPEGIDRVVPFGSALRFSPIWDGYHLMETFLRRITVL